MTGTGVSRKEACSLRESLASPKSIMKIGTWNIRFPALCPLRALDISQVSQSKIKFKLVQKYSNQFINIYR